MTDEGRRRTLPPEETALFCDQIALLLKAGIPLHDGMETLASAYQGGRYGARFAEMQGDLAQSGTLADAMERAGIFPRYACALTRVGERAGKLDEVMRALSDYCEWEADVKTSARNAILYPTVLVILLIAVVAILVGSVLPVFNRVFESLGLSAGAPADAAMRFGMGIGKALLVLAGLLAAALVAVGVLLRGARRDAALDALSFVLPPVRGAREKLAAGRFSSAISMALSAGYPLESAMKLAPAVVTDRRYREKIERCAARLGEGASFADAVTESRLFTPMYAKMVRFGARAG